MSIADYAGRRYDVLALRGAKAQGEVPLDMSLFDAHTYGEICVGIQKLAQRYTLEFLTETGSMPFRNDRGCQFMRDFRLGRLRTEADVVTSFEFSDMDVKARLQAEEDDTWPDDERFARAELTKIIVTEPTLALYVSVVSLAGADRKIILPITHLA